MLGAAPANLAELLKARQSAEGAYVSVTATGTRRLAYNQLYERAGAMATWLAQETGDPPQGREAHAIVLTLADPLEFVTAFFAVALIGAVPVPGPTRVDARPGHKARLVNIVKASRPAFVIADDDRTGALREALDQCDVTILPIGQAATSQGIDPAAFRVHPSCYEQYTSGSVSVPRPIVISQENVLAQLRQAAEAFGETHDSVSVNWVPLYHDMGLVTSVLRPLWSDYTSVLLDAFHFVREPHIWPAALTDWRATHTSAPDFGYALCARKVTDAGSYDLSALRVARNAGEPVRPATLFAFTDRFASAGFRFSAFKPSYGLAEATLTVTACRPEDPPKIIEFSATSLRSGRAAPAHDGDQATALVSCGPPLRDTEVTIRDESGSVLDGDGQIGEVHIAGPQVAADRAAQSRAAEHTGLGTGDLGFRWRGELVLLGRSRDRFQVRGQNFYPSEIEDAVVAADDRLRPGRAAVIALPGAPHESPSTVVLAEVAREHTTLRQEAAAEIARSITRTVSRDFGLSLREVAVLPAGTLPVTTSGKIRREGCRSLLEQGLLTSPRYSGAGAPDWASNVD